MEIVVKLDLSQYTDNEVAMFLVQGVITREEFNEWRIQRERDFEGAGVSQ